MAGETGFKIWAPVKRRLREDEVTDYEQRTGRKIVRDRRRTGCRWWSWVGSSSGTFELSQTAPIVPWADNYEVPTVQVRRQVKLHGGKQGGPARW
ncbi:hypothetical protein C8E95_6892 [Pseudonocardia autotrophica]|uniref:hypothetical protein n=1 Tax=Pseudonocardia autotrophica TaxID=2074 RepID=UPI00105E4E3C|nr:hypothetical protein [Pseudonocardia autotrophica]TDN65405.1 hypothetical protein C8E95_6892 [Pseudonocardia autotrophica]